MKIALIDDGINAVQYPKLCVSQDLSVSARKIFKRNPEKKLVTEHGSTCARIICNYASDVEFISLQLFHTKDLKSSCKHLATALKWCVQEMIPIIHMSLGSSLLNDYYLLKPIIATAIHQNQIVIAACSNSKQFSVPASIGGVISVSADETLMNDEYRVEHSIKMHTKFFASSKHVLEAEQGCYALTPVTNSYAAPTITAKVHEYLNRFTPLSKTPIDVFRYLAKQDILPRIAKPDFIHNPVIIEPKENKKIFRRYFFTKASPLLKGKCDETSNKDIILFPGILESDIPDVSNVNNVLIVGEAISNEKPIGKGFIWSEIDLKEFCKDSKNESKEIECPIIRVIGTEKEMITVSIQLKKMFRDSGYQCLCVSDLPYAYLYEMEYQPNLFENLDALHEMFYYYQPDIMLLTSTKADRNIAIEDILTIILNESDNIKPRIGSKAEGTFIYFPWAKKKDSEKLFDIVLKKFS